MNQKTIHIKLRELTDDDRPFGSHAGKATFRRLVDAVEAHPHCKVFGISLQGITATDATFARESVASVAKHFRGDRGFFLSDVADRDLLDNFSYGAQAKDQPFVVWAEKDFEIIGLETRSSTREMVECVIHHRTITTAKAAQVLQMSVPNASTRLKKLVELGYILRSEESAPSGGIEFIYHAIA